MAFTRRARPSRDFISESVIPSEKAWFIKRLSEILFFWRNVADDEVKFEQILIWEFPRKFKSLNWSSGFISKLIWIYFQPPCKCIPRKLFTNILKTFEVNLRWQQNCDGHRKRFNSKAFQFEIFSILELFYCELLKMPLEMANLNPHWSLPGI